jgi:hypothetical protein
VSTSHILISFVISISFVSTMTESSYYCKIFDLKLIRLLNVCHWPPPPAKSWSSRWGFYGRSTKPCMLLLKVTQHAWDYLLCSCCSGFFCMFSYWDLLCFLFAGLIIGSSFNSKGWLKFEVWTNSGYLYQISCSFSVISNWLWEPVTLFCSGSPILTLNSRRCVYQRNLCWIVKWSLLSEVFVWSCRKHRF